MSYPQESASLLPLKARTTTKFKDKNLKTPADASAIPKADPGYFEEGKWRHLLEGLHRREWPSKGRGAVTWPFLMRLRNEFGADAVDRALSWSTLNEDPPRSSAAGYLRWLTGEFAAGRMGPL